MLYCMQALASQTIFDEIAYEVRRWAAGAQDTWNLAECDFANPIRARQD